MDGCCFNLWWIFRFECWRPYCNQIAKKFPSGSRLYLVKDERRKHQQQQQGPKWEWFTAEAKILEIEDR